MLVTLISMQTNSARENEDFIVIGQVGDIQFHMKKENSHEGGSNLLLIKLLRQTPGSVICEPSCGMVVTMPREHK